MRGGGSGTGKRRAFLTVCFCLLKEASGELVKGTLGEGSVGGLERKPGNMARRLLTRDMVSECQDTL